MSDPARGMPIHEARGCTEYAGDCEPDDTHSRKFHRTVGFDEAGRIAAHVKKL